MEERKGGKAGERKRVALELLLLAGKMERTQVKGKGRRRKVVGEREDEKGGDCQEGERKRKTRGRRGEKKGGSCRKREREEEGRERVRRREVEEERGGIFLGFWVFWC